MIEFSQPMWLLGIIPVLILTILIIRKDFTKLQADRKKLKTARTWVAISRSVVFVLIFVALANPTILIKTEMQTPPRISLLIDNTSSMQVFDMSFVQSLEKSLSEKIPLETKYIGYGTVSDIGDGIMANIEQDKNILLISDGRVTEGTRLEDVALFASNLNVTISAINIDINQKDAAISIAGPSKTVVGAQNTFILEKKDIGSPEDAPTVLEIDGIAQNTFSVTQTFSTEGYHTISAKMQSSDFYARNNEFYKTVKVLEKPTVLYVTEKQDPLEEILRELYNVEKYSSIPSDLSKYHAIVLNDLPASRITNTEPLRNYVIEGNGMVVIGGFESFDRGDYKSSVIESLLPVQVGTGEKRKGGSNIVILYDISGSTKGKTTIGENIADTERQLTASVINNLASSNKVSIVAFNTNAYQLVPLQVLGANKQKIIDRIGSVSTGGGTSLSVGLSAAYQVIKNVQGDRVIILISDGVSNGELDVVKALELSRIYGEQGVRIYTVGVGMYANSDLLKQIANEGHGSYFKGDDSQRIRILFGDPSENSQSRFALFVVDSGHFITSGLDIEATVDAFNQVAPKSSSRMLIATENGNPAVTVWRYGLGRVVSVNAFSSANDLGEILNRKNSLLVTRIVNWAVGDPERKSEYSISVEDTRIDKNVLVRVRSQSYPAYTGMNFFKVDENEYAASFEPAGIGIQNVLNARYAVNYEKEFEDLGASLQLDYIVQSTGGKFFNSQEIDSIVEYVKSVSRKTRINEISLQWILIISALVVFLLEVCARRMKVMVWQNI